MESHGESFRSGYYLAFAPGAGGRHKKFANRSSLGATVPVVSKLSLISKLKGASRKSTKGHQDQD